MAQSTTNLGKIHVFPSEALYNQFKDIIADNDLALLKMMGRTSSPPCWSRTAMLNLATG